MSSRIICMALAVFSLTAPASADWGHWRGEGGNGVSTSAKPPVTWSATDNVKWKAAVPGRGSGSPVVWGDRVFVVSAVDDKGDAGDWSSGNSELRFVLLCFDRATGELLWERTATRATPHEGTHRTNSFASASPTTDGEHVWAHFGSRGLYCYTVEGEKVWSHDFGQMRTRNTFGEGSSPTLVGNLIIVPWDHEGPSFLYAMDKLTGEVRWKTPRDEPTNWSTPLIVEHDGNGVVVMNGQTCARAYDLQTGEELWRCAGQTQRPAASAVAQDGLVFVMSGFRGSYAGAFRLDGRGDLEGTSSVAWSVGRDTPDIASPLLSGGRLYYYKGKSGLLTCVDAITGEPHYKTQRIGLGNIYASPVAANGYVYLSDRDGKTVVIEDSPELKVVATNDIGETIDATPAPVDGELFIRGESHLYCFGE